MEDSLSFSIKKLAIRARILPFGFCRAKPRYWALTVGKQCKVSTIDELDWEMWMRRLILETIRVLLFLRRGKSCMT
jgi:hypothetical protein